VEAVRSVSHEKVLLALLTATTSKMLVDEAKEWMTWLPGKPIRWTAKHFKDVVVIIVTIVEIVTPLQYL
jgi:hypothetical protein